MKRLPNSTRRHQLGFTMVELLVYMGLFMGFITLLSGLFASTLDIQREATETAHIEQDSQYLYSRLQYDLDRATAVTTPAANGATSPTLVLTTPTGTMTYFVQNNQLKVTEGSETATLTSPDISVTQLQFQRLGKTNGVPSIRTQLGLSSTYGGISKPETRSLVFTMGLR